MSIYKGTSLLAGMPDVSGKANTDLSNVSSNIDYVIESYQNGTDWYRLYKSGWVEQGGRQTGTTTGSVTVTLPITMKDTNYCVLVTSTSSAFYGTGFPVSETQVTMETRGHDYTVQVCVCSYQVSGMSAQGGNQ